MSFFMFCFKKCVLLIIFVSRASCELQAVHRRAHPCTVEKVVDFVYEDPRLEVYAD